MYSGKPLEDEVIQIMTVKEMSAFLKLKEETVRTLVAEGKLPGFKIGKSWRFDMEEVERWIAEMPRNGIGRPGSNDVKEGET